MARAAGSSSGVRIRGRPTSLERMLRRPSVLIAAAASCALAAALVYLAVLHVGVVQRADLRVLAGVVRVPGSRSAPAAEAGVWGFDPLPFPVLAAPRSAPAGCRRRRRP